MEAAAATTEADTMAEVDGTEAAVGVAVDVAVGAAVAIVAGQADTVTTQVGAFMRHGGTTASTDTLGGTGGHTTQDMQSL
jgi:hypothetical protein